MKEAFFVKIYFDNGANRWYNLNMNKTVLIVWLVISAICLGVGITYGVKKEFSVMAVFIVVSLGTAAVGIVRYIRSKNDHNKKDDDD